MDTSPRLISCKAAGERLALSRSHLYAMVREAPGFPKPVRISKGRIAFVAAEIDAYARARIAARDQVA